MKNNQYVSTGHMLKPTTLLKVTLFHGCFSRFLDCTNGTKSRKAPHECLYNKKT